MGADVRLVLGNQLDLDNAVLQDARAPETVVLMIEAPGESTHVWSHKARTALFLSAMRHFREALRAAGHRLEYVGLEEHPEPGFDQRLRDALRRLQASRLSVSEPGDHRSLTLIRKIAGELDVPLHVLPDAHFLISTAEFQAWAGERGTLRMETFYRHVRRRSGVLMRDGEPEGGVWNFDTENRKGFGAAGPGQVPTPPAFTPDEITRGVFAQVERLFPDHPGSLAHFSWPVTRDQALEVLARFVDERLGRFGPHQDAMWTGQPVLWHSLLSAPLNLGLLRPGEVISAALRAWREHDLPLASVEGFIRQVMGWREFIRGVYWRHMPGLADANHFGHTRALPAWYWSGETRMNCMRAVVDQTMRTGYAHHIQRLMVTGNFALLAQLLPAAVCDWYLAVYVDAVDWVERPNTAGMALFADGGRFASKPYAASGAYIQRMSNYCRGCHYDPRTRIGERACPVTLLYWAFVDRHEPALAANPRTVLMAKNLEKLQAGERQSLRSQAERVLDKLDAL